LELQDFDAISYSTHLFVYVSVSIFFYVLGLCVVSYEFDVNS